MSYGAVATVLAAPPRRIGLIPLPTRQQGRRAPTPFVLTSAPAGSPFAALAFEAQRGLWFVAAQARDGLMAALRGMTLALDPQQSADDPTVLATASIIVGGAPDAADRIGAAVRGGYAVLVAKQSPALSVALVLTTEPDVIAKLANVSTGTHAVLDGPTALLDEAAGTKPTAKAGVGYSPPVWLVTSLIGAAAIITAAIVSRRKA